MNLTYRLAAFLIPLALAAAVGIYLHHAIAAIEVVGSR